jgi:tetratricopeptide (TPR) repeat protein
MINIQGIRYLFLLIFYLSCFFSGLGQPTLDPDLKKPVKYENRVLRAEKTGEKKFTVPRRFTQNTYTHYNYVFNAKAKLDQVLETAKSQHIDRFAELLSFYNYSLENTATQKAELDSVIYKVNAGILLHDLRSNWMDNLYLIMGQAYYYRNTLDTAFMTFQYMNYAFSPKEEDGYDKVIASNSNEGGNALKVVSPEKRNFIKRSLSEPPNRNDALIWLARTHIANNEMTSAATLIQTLRNDPEFPKRLQASLADVTAYWFYKLPQYDSAAFYLEKAIPGALTKQETARWEYLLGQLYNRAGKPEQAKEAFLRCIQHTINPVMEVAAQLQATQQISSAKDIDWQAAITALERMAKRERYTNYRDLIYYTISQIEQRRGKYTEAKAHLLKSVKYSLNNPEQKTRSYLLLAELSYNGKEYVQSKQYYDSVETNLLSQDEATPIEKRREVLQEIALQYYVLSRQDSLQKLAALPEAERTAILKKQLKQIRKQHGLAEEESSPKVGGPVFSPAGNTVPTDLFTSYNSGEWYFYNNSLKSRGFTEFRSKWGNRPNTDNWRRSSAVSNVTVNKEFETDDQKAQAISEGEISLEKLLSQLPLTPEQLKISNDSIQQANFELAYDLQNKLEDYETAERHYEFLLERFPHSEKEPEILYNLFFCYQKLGKADQLAAIKERLKKEYPESRQTKLAIDPKSVEASDSAASRQATAAYNEIYNLFIEGKFDAAIAAKTKADSTFGLNYWTPQLLYIESIYKMKIRDDSAAINTLNELKSQFPESPLAEKATNLISVLQRRSEIEEYLTKLQIERPAEDTVAQIVDEAQKPAVDSGRAVNPAANLPGIVKDKPVSDSNRLKIPTPAQKATVMFSRHAALPHFVVVVLENVDPVYVNETRNAFDRYNKEKYYNVQLNVAVAELDQNLKMVTIKGLPNEQAAVDYISKAKELASKEIIPWLKKDKYYFMPVAEDNMDLLISNKNLPAYRDFLKQIFPDL